MTRDIDTSRTIVALASSPGKGGISVIRVSGSLSLAIAERILGFTPKPRFAHYSDFKDHNQQLLDQGIAIYYPGPHSFTGEDVVEFQCHGGPMLVDILIEEIILCGAIMASPGEFSLRAYLNDKMDLMQAEAVCDLINATSSQSARSALNSLQGAFSQRIDQSIEQLTALRVYTEASIDFPEEEIDFLSDPKLLKDLNHLIANIQTILQQARQGVVMQEGIQVVILGQPNVGKSSLFNALADEDLAIVTNQAGTTRDLIKTTIHLEGILFKVCDTAGIRNSEDHIEQAGIKKAKAQLELADIVLFIDEAHQVETQSSQELMDEMKKLNCPYLIIHNKADLLEDKTPSPQDHEVWVSAKTGAGLSHLKSAILSAMDIQPHREGTFTARRRHLTALEDALRSLDCAQQNLVKYRAGEMMAEDLRSAQLALSEIKGEVSSDILLGHIFSSFCIGK